MSVLREKLGLPQIAPTTSGEWPAELNRHLSANALTTYHRCREQFRQRYLLGRKEPPKGYLLWGSADGITAEFNYRQKIASHTDLPVREIEERFSVAVDDLVDEAGGESQVEWERTSAADVKDRGVKLAAAYHTVAAPRVQPISVQEEIAVHVDGVPIPIIGYIDVTTEGEIIERKTAGRKWTTPAGNYLAQGRVYQLAKQLPLHFHVGTKTQTPGIYTPTEEPSLLLAWSAGVTSWAESWIRRTAQAIAFDYATFGPDQPWPDSMALRESPCSWCGFRPVCPAWESETVF